jgi:hypothetical protein
MSIQRGDLIPIQFVDEEGQVHTSYETAGLKDRIATARFLANKVLPSLTVTKHLLEAAPAEETPGQIGAPGQPSFAALVSAAASRAVPVHSTEIKNGGTPDDQADSVADEFHRETDPGD